MIFAVASRALAILAASLLVCGLWSSAAGIAANSKGNAVTAPLRTLVAKTDALPANALPKGKRLGLEKTAADARVWAGKRPCKAIRDLAHFRRILLGVKVRRGRKGTKRGVRIATLAPLSLRATSGLLASKRTKACGGGTKPSRRHTTEVKILRSDANGLKLKVQLAQLRFVPKTGGGRTWTQLTLTGTEAPGKPGTPGIPALSNLIGVPDGAKVVAKAANVDSYDLGGVNVYPAQPDPADAIVKAPSFGKPPFVNGSFVVDEKAYRAKGLQPDNPVDGSVLGQARDLTIGDLSLPVAQYNAKKKTLKVLTSLVVNIDFKGGSHAFSSQLSSPWERPQRSFAASMINANAITTTIPEIVRPCGFEMLVLTNPATRTAADVFANARRAAGFRTVVAETGTGPGQIGTTAAEIQAYVRARLTAASCIHPSYITIMGDDELVPTFPGINGIPSDLQYSMRDDADELPDVAVGRILGADQAQVGAAVDKIIGYETKAPGSGDFFTHATLAAQFQDVDGEGQVNDGQENRTFSQFAETVRSGLVKRGVTVDRVYGDEPETEPKRFNDGTALPASLLKPTFPWDGTGADVSADWNAGRFLIIHRDHGWSDGWGTPFFTTNDVEALTNGSLLPVVMSINCASAEYDNDETSFVQQALVKANGGAVGVFGDTRNSPTWHNSQIGLGFVDGLLPSVLPSEGPATAQRMGDALINGKLRLAGLAPPGSDGNTRSELYLWHYFGDPSMQMWGGGHPPRVFDPSLFKAVFREEVASGPGPGPEPPYSVLVNLPAELAGQPISLLRGGEVIGKAIAGDGSVTIPATFDESRIKPGELEVAVEADGAQPVSAPVEGVPRVATSLQQACPAGGKPGLPLAVTGTLSGAPTGSMVEVTFTPPQEGPIVVKTTTDQSGAWSASVTPTESQRGNWTIASSYSGTAEYAESKAGPCTVPVFFEVEIF